ncbi:dihydrolipoyl dehydrogenase, partial [Planktomarina sp.]|nr:dihydrolipoyl dehydrogenase [Planktomarina sp.]
AQHNFAKMGLIADNPSVDWNKMQGYKSEVIEGNTKGIEFLFKKNKIDWLKGWASIPNVGEILIDDETYTAKHIIIASGSEPSTLPGIEIDEKIVVTSTGALALDKIPTKMIVIGAGVIGLELGSVYARLGTEVEVIEFLDEITPGMDAEIQKNFKRILKKQGLKFTMGSAVKSVSVKNKTASVTYVNRKKDTEHQVDADVVLVATGRKPFLDGLGLEALGIALTDGGQIKTDSNYSTNVAGVYAIGDAINGPMLAHKAEDEGMAVAEILAGQAGHVNYGVIPGVIYTHPEVASVGLTEEQLKETGNEFKVGKFSFMGNGRAKANFAGEGFVKILADAATDRILGAHIIGPMAGDLVHEICVAMEFGAAAEDLARTCHAHPTYSEAVREAALACGSGAIHS